MPDWRETHFGVASRPPAPSRRWWPLALLCLPALAVGGLYLADRLGLIDTASWWREAGVLTGPGDAKAPGLDPNRARLLRERAVSQERGIGLMSRERLEVDNDRAIQQGLLDDAVARLRQLEATSTTGMSPTQIDRLRVAHADAVAAAKNATNRIKELDSRRTSLDRRIATSERERDAALAELDQKPLAVE